MLISTVCSSSISGISYCCDSADVFKLFGVLGCVADMYRFWLGTCFVERSWWCRKCTDSCCVFSFNLWGLQLLRFCRMIQIIAYGCCCSGLGLFLTPRLFAERCGRCWISTGEAGEDWKPIPNLDKHHTPFESRQEQMLQFSGQPRKRAHLKKSRQALSALFTALVH